MENITPKTPKRAKGLLERYKNEELKEQETEAWAKAVVNELWNLGKLPKIIIYAMSAIWLWQIFIFWHLKKESGWKAMQEKAGQVSDLFT